MFNEFFYSWFFSKVLSLTLMAPEALFFWEELDKRESGFISSTFTSIKFACILIHVSLESKLRLRYKVCWAITFWYLDIDFFLFHLTGLGFYFMSFCIRLTGQSTKITFFIYINNYVNILSWLVGKQSVITRKINVWIFQIILFVSLLSNLQWPILFYLTFFFLLLKWFYYRLAAFATQVLVPSIWTCLILI